MYATIIHNKDRVPFRKGIHVFQESFDEFGEECPVIRTLDDRGKKESIERKSGENGKAMREVVRYGERAGGKQHTVCLV